VTRPVVMAIASADEARRFAARHELDFVDALHLAGAELPTRHGAFRIEAFASVSRPGTHHLALVHGDLAAAPLVRVHVACPAGERFGSLLCDCAARLGAALEAVGAADAGVLVYLRGEDETLVTALDGCVRRTGRADDGAAAAILRALGCYQAEPATT
jgi:GTP cyclohydrolase II